MTDEIIIRLDENVRFLREKVMTIDGKLDEMERRNGKADLLQQSADSNFKLLMQSVNSHQKDDDREFKDHDARIGAVEKTTEQYKNDRAKIIGGTIAGSGIFGAIGAWLSKHL